MNTGRGVVGNPLRRDQLILPYSLILFSSSSSLASRSSKKQQEQEPRMKCSTAVARGAT